MLALKGRTGPRRSDKSEKSTLWANILIPRTRVPGFPNQSLEITTCLIRTLDRPWSSAALVILVPDLQLFPLLHCIRQGFLSQLTKRFNAA